MPSARAISSCFMVVLRGWDAGCRRPWKTLCRYFESLRFCCQWVIGHERPQRAIMSGKAVGQAVNQIAAFRQGLAGKAAERSEERRVGKECRTRVGPEH